MTGQPVLGKGLSPHSPDNALGFGVTCAILRLIAELRAQPPPAPA